MDFQNFKNAVIAKCAELGIGHMVRILGYRRDIDKLLAACDCVVSSSRQEGLPLNLIEAAARGRYIIATDVRGNADVVLSSGCGVLVELNDDAAMAAEIAKVCQTAPAIPDRSRIDCYRSENIVRRLFELYGV